MCSYHAKVKLLFFLSQWLNSLSWPGLLSSDLTVKVFQWDWGSSSYARVKVSVEDILDTERRQEDCLLAATGWIREKIPGMLRKHSFPGLQTEEEGNKSIHGAGETYIPTHTHTHTRGNKPQTHNFPNQYKDDQNRYWNSNKYRLNDWRWRYW